jgi:N-acetylmuramoyl-L-alanine amidase
MPRKPHPANGFEIYLLKPSRTEEAVAIASRENAVIKLEEGYEKRYQELTEENFILLTMAQTAYAHYSEQFAQETIRSMEQTLPFSNNGVKQAGFYVLIGASMPNILVEAGYLSNRKEEQYLASQKGQQNIAEAIFTAVKNYKTEYEKTLEPGGGR